MVNLTTMKDAAADMRVAMESNDSSRIEKGWENICLAASQNALAEMKADVEAYRESKDEAILEKRGMRMLTSKEKAYYSKVIDAMKSANPKQAFIDVLTDAEDAMPETIIEDVLRGITQEHPLLSRINAQYVGYLTKWVLNTHTAQAAAWGTITAAIEQEITSSVDVIDIRQNKISCFAILELGMIDLGPEWLDSYVRAVLTEALSYGLEQAVVSGTGSSQPIGMDRDLTSEASGVYTQKTATAVTDFKPATYGEIVAGIAVDANGKPRSINGLSIIVNQTTYLTKIMPATTLLNSAGQFVNTAFPIATEVIISNALADNLAIIGVPENYFLGIGKSARNSAIEYSDEYKFIEDQRVFKMVNYADGRAIDNTAFALLDVSAVEAATLAVVQG